MDAVVEHWEDLAFQSPGLVFREVPVKYVDFVLCQFGYFPFQFFHRDVGTSYVLHKSTDTESRPVDYFTSGDEGSAAFLFRQLAEGLYGPINALFCGCLDSDLLR